MKKIRTGDFPSPQFIENIFGVCGERGEAWLNALPETIGELTEKWSLIVDKPFPNLSYNYVAPCVDARGNHAVLKIGLPESNPVIFSEARFLNFLAGKGTVNLLQIDEKRRALLLERAIPGEDLTRLCRIDDEQATHCAVEVLRRIQCESLPTEFPTLQSWTDDFQKAAPINFARDAMKKAQDYFAELLAASNNTRLLHGDFHHQNILSAERESFLVIDPKGIVGDIGFEISVFLNNPRGWLLSHPNRQTIGKRRLEIFSEAFAVEPRDLRKWAYAEAVLSAWWTIEDGGSDARKWLACADIWESLN
jgi:streptomycin 6-kinase